MNLSPPPAAEQQVSAIFCEADADTTFISSDNVLFKIHGQYLDLMTSTGFAKASEHTSVGPEPIHLSEKADVLEILFQFIEPPSESRNYRQPSLDGLHSTLFFRLAEAAEKYVVYGAMNICIVRMTFMFFDAPLEVLNHCDKHGYPDLINLAAKHSLSQPFNDIASKLTAPGLLPRWLIYYSQWRTAAKYATEKFEQYSSSDCRVWTRLSAIYSRQLCDNPTKIDTKPSLPPNFDAIRCIARPCSCRDFPKDWPPWFHDILLAVYRERFVADFSTITVAS